MWIVQPDQLSEKCYCIDLVPHQRERRITGNDKALMVDSK